MNPTIRSLAFLALLAGLLLAQSTSAWAQDEPLALYEDWRSADDIRGDRWNGAVDSLQEFHRVVKGNRLSMYMRTEGATGSDSGTVLVAHRLFFAPQGVNQIEATVKVTLAEATGCASNPAVSDTRPIALTLVKFGDGPGPVPGDFTGDYLARIQIHRDSSTVDSPRVLKVRGVLAHCLNPGCIVTDTVGAVDFPTPVELEHDVRLSLSWDPFNNQFLYGLDDALMAVPYPPEANARPSSSPFADMRQIGVPANCTAGSTLVQGSVEVSDVRTNASAVIP